VKLFHQNWNSGAKEQHNKFYQNGTFLTVLMTVLRPPNACVEILAEWMPESTFRQKARSENGNQTGRIFSVPTDLKFWGRMIILAELSKTNGP